MIPYYPQPVLHLGPFQIHAFGALAALAVIVGGRVVLMRAHRQGIPFESMFRFCFWIYTFGMIGAFFWKLALDDFPAFLADPSHIFQVRPGVASVPGILTGFFAGLVWSRYHRLSLLEVTRRFDIITYALPSAWMIGRLGCTLAHDHRGIPSAGWIAVKFPEGPAYDLGLIEFLFLIAMVIVFKLLDRRPRPVGFFFGLYSVVYASFRIWLEPLRLRPSHPYGAMAGVLIGLAGWGVMLALERERRRGSEVGQASPQTAG